ncbi:hypothetical protein Pcinc_041098 [Petrolisthes cinctipes]|uniref:Uncharacterized protein n=1 Tax=Petrolisthes cinctipes TaxID=88211 RepID=A0AAE1BNZ9_PETCI|nr:hypothetical protein Pcinc_041098 [Petrolisthes cinctipes]
MDEKQKERESDAYVLNLLASDYTVSDVSLCSDDAFCDGVAGASRARRFPTRAMHCGTGRRGWPRQHDRAGMLSFRSQWCWLGGVSKDGVRVVAVAGKTNKLRREAKVCVNNLPEDPCLAPNVQHKVKCKGSLVTVCVVQLVVWCVRVRERPRVCSRGYLETRPD